VKGWKSSSDGFDEELEFLENKRKNSIK